MNELNQTYDVFGLVLGRPNLEKRIDVEVTEVDLEHCRVGLVVVPCEDDSCGHPLSGRIPHLKYS